MPAYKYCDVESDDAVFEKIMKDAKNTTQGILINELHQACISNELGPLWTKLVYAFIALAAGLVGLVFAHIRYWRAKCSKPLYMSVKLEEEEELMVKTLSMGTIHVTHRQK